MTTEAPRARGIPVAATLKTLIDLRTAEQIVVTNQASARAWPALASHPLDFHYNPSTMGGAIPLGLGLALAQPRREVLVVSGDGALLMSLGSLVTVAGTGATNITVVVLENGRYEVTGGQKTPAAVRSVDFVAIARGAGFPVAARFDDAGQWQYGAGQILSQPGPRFVCLVVEPTPAELLRAATPPVAEQLDRLRRSLRASEPVAQ